ncbi:MAG: hypothetical protein CM15mV52_0940 [uncultured marine virus]|nr:MAG: hypothetical protein CM15mV52_0940 [uncultured marine virus]
MAFFLGKDVTVACSTENTTDGIQVAANGTIAFADVTTGFSDALGTGSPAGATGSWDNLQV